MNRINSIINLEREIAANSQMKSLANKYMEYKGFRIFCSTFNVNGKFPKESLGESWLSSDPNPPDIYAIGFQELDLSKEAYLFTDSPREEEWLKAVTFSLHTKAEYVKVRLVRLIGMMLVIFVKKELQEYVSDVSSCTVGTGLLGKMGNKGGVSIRFNLHQTSLCFINSHFAPHPEEIERRNQDFTEICMRTVFQCDNEIFYIKDHDLIYWLGDLNYRLNDLTTDEVKKAIDNRKVEILFNHDQLKQQQKQNKVFLEYNEAPIRFQPTYKYDVGTDVWDTSEKNRAPAWCDRILWTGTEPTKCIVYRSHPKLRLSDHKPVSALFDTQIKVINPENYKKTYKEVMMILDRNENDTLPQVSVDKNQINFGKLSFRDMVTDTLTIKNTGLTDVHFEFIKKLNEASYCPPWLKIKPHQGVLMIGKSKTLDIEICVDQSTVTNITKRKAKIDEILVLRLDKRDKNLKQQKRQNRPEDDTGRKDIFISLVGDYIPSSFGCSIQCLVHLKKSVSEYNPNELADLLNKYDHVKSTTTKSNQRNELTITKPLIEFDDNPSTSVVEALETCSNEDKEFWELPKELWLLVNQLFKYGMDVKELFMKPSLRSEFIQIRNAIDTCDSSKLLVSTHSVAESILLFLDALAEPVIPFEFYYRAIDSVKNFALCKQVINDIPPTHRNVFYYIISFIKEVLKHSNVHRLEPNLMASLFGRVMLKPSDQRLTNNNYDLATMSNDKIDSRNRSLFVYHFLINDFDI